MIDVIVKSLVFFSSVAQGPALTQQDAVTKLIEHIDAVCVKHAIAQDSACAAKKLAVDKVYENGADINLTDEQFNRIRASVIAELVFGNKCSLNVLPVKLKELNEDDLLDIFYFTSVRQTNGWTCGYWTIPNALALQSAFEQNKVSTDFISRFALDFFRILGEKETQGKYTGIAYCQKFLHEKSGTHKEIDSEGKEVTVSNFLEGSKEFLDAGNIVKLCSLPHVYLKNLHILAFSGGRDEGILFEQTAPGVPEEYRNYAKEYLTESCIEYIRNDLAQSQKALHLFICNLQVPEPHWILIAVMKLSPNSRPVMAILDSYNIDLKDTGDMIEFVKFLHTAFIANYSCKNYADAEIG